jgi:hypothetical protein
MVKVQEMRGKVQSGRMVKAGVMRCSCLCVPSLWPSESMRRNASVQRAPLPMRGDAEETARAMLGHRVGTVRLIQSKRQARSPVYSVQPSQPHGARMGNALLVPVFTGGPNRHHMENSNFDYLRFFVAFAVCCTHQPTTVYESE